MSGRLVAELCHRFVVIGLIRSGLFGGWPQIWKLIEWTTISYYAALLPRRGRILRRTLSVCLSVCPSVPLLFLFTFFYSRTVLRANIQNIKKTSVFAYGPASRMYFSARTEGRISYGHLGRTNSCSIHFRCANNA